MTHTLQPLPYTYNALEPYIDEATMHIHHDKHHQAYVDNLNKALEESPEFQKLTVEQLLKDLSKIPNNIRTPIRNHGGGVFNHNFFWSILKKDTGEPKGKLADAITKKFGSYEKFKEEFTKASMGRFGSGWAWLVINHDQSAADGYVLEIISTANQDSPISDGKIPLLCNDVWEHAYYLKYQNRRAEYVAAFFNVINWRKVEELYNVATKKK